LALEISHQFETPLKRAFDIASRLSSGERILGPLQLSADLASIEAEIAHRLETAIETVVRRPRGRPPRRAY